jgi:hypothetical protein
MAYFDHPKGRERKLVHISITGTHIYGLADDGSVWMKAPDDKNWKFVAPNIPPKLDKKSDHSRGDNDE